MFLKSLGFRVQVFDGFPYGFRVEGVSGEFHSANSPRSLHKISYYM